MEKEQLLNMFKKGQNPTEASFISLIEAIYSQGGKDGLSAYEIGVINGFEGTEEEWLNQLKAKQPRAKKAITISEIELLVDEVKVVGGEATLSDDSKIDIKITNI